jgi:hypothetical protein
MAKGNSKGIANLTPWQKGQSGNPAGVSKAIRQFHDAFKGELIRELSAPSPFDATGKTIRLQAIVRRLCDAAEGGEIAAVREILDRLLGKPKQDVALEVENAGMRQAFERMTPAELMSYAETGSLPAWLESEAMSDGRPIQ